MLALVYLVIMIALGDAVCRRFYAFVSLPHRFAVAFLTGLVISSWWTYVAAWLFSSFSSPMLWGNLVYFVTAIGLILWLREKPQSSEPRLAGDLGVTEFERTDWVFVGAFFLLVSWMAFATFDMTEGKLQIATHQWSDFGSNVSLMQTFALGHNFPTQYPHFSGERIHYHFLYYFQAGNLEYLGLNPATANNVLSILSVISMLVLVMTLGVALFRSKVVGRIAAVLFFFHGSLSYIPWLYAQGTSNAWTAITSLRDFLPSIFPYRGETWGVWSQVVYLNQRHLASSIGIFLVVVVFLLLRYREALALDPAAPESPPAPTEVNEAPLETAAEVEESEAALPETPKPKKKRSGRRAANEKTDLGDVQKFTVRSSAAAPEDNDAEAASQAEVKPRESKARKTPATPKKPKEPRKPFALFGEPLSRIWPFVFSGFLLGLLPMWNGAVFAAAAAVLVMMLALFPLRRQMIILGIVAGLVAIPQVMYLGTWDANPGRSAPSLLHWGYTLDDPTIVNVVWYLVFTFGFKWLLVGIGLLAARNFQRRFFLAITVLIGVAFCMQFSDEVLANHKFLNIWLVLANLFAGYGIWWLWDLSWNAIAGKVAAVVLTVLVVVGGIIDLFPVHNAFFMEMPMNEDRLVTWTLENTDPRAIFLSPRWVNHRILLAGRRVFFGHPYYAWSAGYPTGERDGIYRKMFESTDAQEVFRLLKENNIAYVAIDNSLRNSDYVKNINESIYEANFQKVFEDTENKYDSLKVYKVPDALGAVNPPASPGAAPMAPGQVQGENAFTAGNGNRPGQMSKPRGIAADSKGNIYIADLGNSRVQKYDADGKFILAFGTAGDGEGQLKEPNGVAVDASNNVWVVDALNHKLLKFTADGVFVKEWKGPPENTFYGPRDIAIGPNKALYIVDQGRGRVVKFDPASESYSEFGSLGSGEGQFHEATGIAIAGDNVVVADAANNRIQVFDLSGKFVRAWPIAGADYARDAWHYPDVVYDESAKKLYITNGWTSEVAAYDLEGQIVTSTFKPEANDKLDNPSSIVISEADKKRRVLVLNTNGCKVTALELEPAKAAAKTAK